MDCPENTAPLLQFNGYLGIAMFMSVGGAFT
jgi:hypothetical protein